MAFNFPNTPNIDDTYTSGGLTYIWDGQSWETYNNPDVIINYGLTALIRANDAIQSANNVSNTSLIVGQYANTAIQKAITSGDYANSAFGQANTGTDQSIISGGYANSAFSAANVADQKAVTSGVYANAAFDTANNNYTTLDTAKLNKTGGTITSDLVIEGNLTVQGATATVSTTNLSVEDNMIYLNSNSAIANPDLGFAGNYNDGAYAHAGLFRDATDGVWKFFDGYTPEPDASEYIDTSNASFALANVQSGNLNIPDGGAITFGNSPDLYIFHDGSNSYVRDKGTGALNVQTNGSLSIELYVDDATSDRMARFVGNGQVELYYNALEKLATTSTGVDITGSLVSDGLTVDGASSLNGATTVQQILEKTNVVSSQPTSTINADATGKPITYFTVNTNSDWTLNIRGDNTNTLDSVMSVGDALTVVTMVTQGSTAFRPTGLQIDGTTQSVKWMFGLTPISGTPNSVETYTFNVIKTSSVPTYTVLGSTSNFS
jgi:hypothetical protein